MDKATGIFEEYLEKSGPYIGPKGGKYADPQHKIPWRDKRPDMRYTNEEKKEDTKMWGGKDALSRINRTVDKILKKKDNWYLSLDAGGGKKGDHWEVKASVTPSVSAKYSPSLINKLSPQVLANDLAEGTNRKWDWVEKKSKDGFSTYIFFSKQRDNEKGMKKAMTEETDILDSYLEKSGPYIGPKGGKYADPQHKIPWDENKDKQRKRARSFKELDERIAVRQKKNADKIKAAVKPQLEAIKRSIEASALTPDIKSRFKRASDIMMRQKNPLFWNHYFQYGVNQRTIKETVTDIATGKKIRGLNKEDMVKAMEETDILNGYLEKSEKMPTGKASLGTGKEQGEKLAGKGKQGGKGQQGGGGLDPKTGLSEKVVKDKLSEDDEEQLKAKGKKPIEEPKKYTVKKSLDPASQRGMVAKEQAVAINRLTKGNDVYVQPIATPTEQPKPLQKSGYTPTTKDGLVGFSEDSDREMVEFLEKGYRGPSVTYQAPFVAQGKKCEVCNSIMSKSLSACPYCGDGTVQHKTVQTVTKSLPNTRLRPVRKQDLKITD